MMHFNIIISNYRYRERNKCFNIKNRIKRKSILVKAYL